MAQGSGKMIGSDSLISVSFWIDCNKVRSAKVQQLPETIRDKKQAFRDKSVRITASTDDIYI